MSWAAKECFLLRVAIELGGKWAGRQKSVYHCGWQMSWAAKECLLWAAKECFGLGGKGVFVIQVGKRVFYILGGKRVFIIVGGKGVFATGGKGVFIICGKNPGGKSSGVKGVAAAFAPYDHGQKLKNWKKSKCFGQNIGQINIKLKQYRCRMIPTISWTHSLWIPIILWTHCSANSAVNVQFFHVI